MKPRKTKELVGLIETALLSSKSTTPFGFESAFRARYPWFTIALRCQIQERKWNDDAALLDFLDTSAIDWQRLREYDAERQHMADVARVSYNSTQIKHDDVIARVFSSVLRYRIALKDMTLRELLLEQRRSLNANWIVALRERADNDPLADLPQPRYSHWLAKPKWTRKQFVSLLLKIDPSKFDLRTVEISTPYSVVGTKAKKLLRLIDDGVSTQEIKLPGSPKELYSWASSCGIPIPSAMRRRGALKDSEDSDLPPAAVATISRIREATQKFVEDRSYGFSREQLLRLIRERLSRKRISDNAFDKQIWQKLPKAVKLKGGRPSDAWTEDEPVASDAFRNVLEQLLRVNP